jgi:two-component system sensor histidine kinase QseC
MRSIRGFQLVTLVAGTAIVCGAGTIVLHRVLRGSLHDRFDAGLADTAAVVGTLLELDPPDVDFDFDARTMPAFLAGPDAEYFQVWVEGLDYARSPSLGGGATLPLRFSPPDRPVAWNLELPDGRAGRAVGIELAVMPDADHPVPVASPPTAVVVVARSREGLEGDVLAVTGVLAAEAVLITVALVGLVVWTLRRGLAPVRRLGDDVGAVDTARLGHRFTLEDTPRELRPILAGLNRMLERLETGFERERRTTANIAHELRTPLAELRAATEVALRWTDDDELTSRTMEETHRIAVQMQGTVSMLLHLSRLESGEATFTPEEIDVPETIRRHCTGLRSTAERHRIELDLDLPPSARARVDRHALDLVLGNLLSNALTHTEDGGRVRCRARANGTTVRVDVTNPNGSLEAADLANLAEPFWRKDAARSGREHLGLGLTMASAVARAAGIGLTLALEDDRFVARLVLPAAGADAAADDAGQPSPPGRTADADGAVSRSRPRAP